MGDTIEIALCMGSSCFARGNNVLLEALEDLIKARGWEDKITLTGLRCGDLCTQGPNIRIDGDLYTAMDEGALLDLLESRLGGRSGPARVSVRLSADPRKKSDRKGV